MKKIDLLLEGALILLFISLYVWTGDLVYLAFPAAVVLVLPIQLWRWRRDRQADRD